MSDLLAKLTKWIATEVALDPAVLIDVDTELLVSGLVDSLGVVQIVSWLEEQLELHIDPVDVVFENFETPAAISDFAERLQSATS